MPDTGQEEYDEEIDISSDLSLTVTTQGNVDIITEPGTQGDVPSSPEFTDTVATVRIVEVLLELETEHLAETDRHIRITREIKVDL